MPAFDSLRDFHPRARNLDVARGPRIGRTGLSPAASRAAVSVARGRGLGAEKGIARPDLSPAASLAAFSVARGRGVGAEKGIGRPGQSLAGPPCRPLNALRHS